MAEYIYIGEQTVTPNNNVIFASESVSGKRCIIHRVGSGIVKLRGITEQCRALFKVSFGANVGLPTGATVGPVSVAITQDGETILTMTVTPIVAGAFNNVYESVFIEVPKGCCATVGIKNVNDEDILVNNANLIIERVA